VCAFTWGFLYKSRVTSNPDFRGYYRHTAIQGRYTISISSVIDQRGLYDLTETHTSKEPTYSTDKCVQQMQHAFEPHGQPTSADTKPTLKAGFSSKGKKKEKGKTIVDNNKTLGD
jgi:hypothetical protein